MQRYTEVILELLHKDLAESLAASAKSRANAPIGTHVRVFEHMVPPEAGGSFVQERVGELRYDHVAYVISSLSRSK